ncbi:MAG: ImmA/IrrE family metallo-endopeptidase [Candidatus Eisenbacteria bacterium]|nr:ImmA/IrrE family metallo-endopeptidase [Candidatus Eisenbacteria bacterium]
MTIAVVDPLVDLLRRAGENGLDADRLAPLFTRFVTIGIRHAALERVVLGSVPLSFPSHLLDGKPHVDDDLAHGITLAERERDRLGADPADIDRLERMIEDQGVKVITLPFPAASGLLSAFLFHADTGPAILIDATASPHARDYALAHGYGHYLADHDPWRTWTCRLGGGGDSAEELRAHGFAGAFLVPEKALTRYLSAVSKNLLNPVPAKLVRQLQIYFDADPRAILGRLLAGGRITTAQIAPLVAELQPDPAVADEGTMDADTGPHAGTGLSDRYITLAVMAYRGGHLDLAGLARSLETDEAIAMGIDQRFRREAPVERNDGERTD